MESMLVQYNLLDRTNEEMLHYAASNGVGTVAMGPVGGGRLAAPTELYAKLTGKKSIATFFPVANGNGQGIRDAVTWSRTSRGGRQYDIFADGEQASSMCSSKYGLCE